MATLMPAASGISGGSSGGSSSSRSSDWIEERGKELGRYLGPDWISYRKGEGGKMFAYVEGQELITILNGIFGWDGWGTTVKDSVVDYADMSSVTNKWDIGLWCTIRLTVRVKEGVSVVREVSREDIGYGTIENGVSRGKALEKCRKEAFTDGLKRAARQFGNATGNCIYNQKYLDRVKKVKGPQERIEFEDEELLWKPVNKRRRMEYGREREHVVVLGPGKGKVERVDASEFDLGGGGDDDDDDEWMNHLGDEMI